MISWNTALHGEPCSRNSIGSISTGSFRSHGGIVQLPAPPSTGTLDRRFYRHKYDAAQTLATFAATARDEVELDKLTAELLHVVERTRQPATASL